MRSAATPFQAREACGFPAHTLNGHDALALKR
jgi:hypothetical protein